MTPGINLVKKAKINYTIHEYDSDASSTSYGLEACEKLGLPQETVFKTLVVELDNKELVVGVIPISALLSMKSISKAAGAKKANMAAPTDVERSTGYVLGGVSPLGQKKRLRTFIHTSATQHETLYVSAGRRGLEIALNPQDLISLTQASLADICQ